MKAWREWFASMGIQDWQIEWFMQDYQRCRYFERALITYESLR